MELLEGRAIAGTVSGSVHVVQLHTGASNAASATVDHMDAVTGVAGSTWLQHVVTGSRDSHIKVWTCGVVGCSLGGGQRVGTNVCGARGFAS